MVMLSKPVSFAPLPANDTTFLTPDQLAVYQSLIPHYRERCRALPASRFLKEHYSFLVRSVRTGEVGSMER